MTDFSSESLETCRVEDVTAESTAPYPSGAAGGPRLGPGHRTVSAVAALTTKGFRYENDWRELPVWKAD